MLQVTRHAAPAVSEDLAEKVVSDRSNSKPEHDTSIKKQGTKAILVSQQKCGLQALLDVTDAYLEESRQCLPEALPSKHLSAMRHAASFVSHLLAREDAFHSTSLLVDVNGRLAQPASNVYSKDESSVGEWGGICTCPDGAVYEVGDGKNFCASLACEGGVSGSCSKGGISLAHHYMKVVCAATTTTTTTTTTTVATTTTTAKPTTTVAPATEAPAATSEEVDGTTATLDEAGFKAVTSRCCPQDMETFFERLLTSMSLQICSKPHMQGLMHWFSCVPDMDFQYLVDVINNGNPCKYWAAEGSVCPSLSPECEGEWCR
jgi:hypothetical protein